MGRASSDSVTFGLAGGTRRAPRAAARPAGAGKSHRAYLGWLIGAAFALLAPVTAINFVVDPLQYLRKATLYQPQFSRQQRYQNPGIARNYDYDTVVIGSSMTEVIYPADVAEALGGPAVNLSISGSYAREQRLILDVALASGRARRVIWGLDWFTFAAAPEQLRSDQGPFPEYLYDGGSVAAARYLFNVSTLGRSIGIVARLAGVMPAAGVDTDLERLNKWDETSEFGRARVLAAFRAPGADAALRRVFEGRPTDAATIAATFRRNVVEAARAHPETTFFAYLPPHSILHYVFLKTRAPRLYAAALAVRALVLSELTRLPNARVFDLQAEAAITHELDAYRDTLHHSRAVARRILAALRDDGRVDAGIAAARVPLLDDQVAAWIARHGAS